MTTLPPCIRYNSGVLSLTDTLTDREGGKCRKKVMLGMCAAEKKKVQKDRNAFSKAHRSLEKFLFSEKLRRYRSVGRSLKASRFLLLLPSRVLKRLPTRSGLLRLARSMDFLHVELSPTYMKDNGRAETHFTCTFPRHRISLTFSL